MSTHPNPQFNPFEALLKQAINPQAAAPTLQSIKNSKTKFNILVRTQNSGAKPFQQDFGLEHKAKNAPKKEKAKEEQKTMVSSVIDKLRVWKSSIVPTLFGEKKEDLAISEIQSLDSSSTSGIKSKIVRNNVWKLKVQYSSLIDEEFTISINKKRILQDVLDQIMEDLVSKIENNQIDSLLEINSIFLTQNNGKTNLKDLEARIEDLFSQNNLIEVNLEETETLTDLVSPTTKKILNGTIPITEKFSLKPSALTLYQS